MSKHQIQKKCVLTLATLTLFIQCASDSCEGEPRKAKVESNSVSERSNRVWVTFIHQPSGQSFQVVDVTEDNAKTTAPLPAGEYRIQATVSKSTGNYAIRMSAQFKDCVDYKVFVNAIRLSMNLNGQAR